MDERKLLRLAETLDGLIRADIPARGVIGVLYEAARHKTGYPLTLAAVNLLRQVVKPGDPVVITTGWVDQPLVAPGRGESDGPPGALALARALRLALKAAPVILTDECLVDGVKRVAQAAGFQCVLPEEIAHSIERDKLLTTSVLPFPADEANARQESQVLLERLKPVACIAVERGGGNIAGVIHNMAGFDTGAGQAKLDYFFQAARQRNVATIAVGDGGNEIGMGNIVEAVRESVPQGDRCQCPCGAGVAAATTVDVLVTASISNWGAYALAAMLAAVTGVTAAVNDADKERRVLEATAAAGFHDPISGGVFPGADGCGLAVHLAMVALMQEAVLNAVNRN